MAVARGLHGGRVGDGAVNVRCGLEVRARPGALVRLGERKPSGCLLSHARRQTLFGKSRAPDEFTKRADGDGQLAAPVFQLCVVGQGIFVVRVVLEQRREKVLGFVEFTDGNEDTCLPMRCGPGRGVGCHTGT